MKKVLVLMSTYNGDKYLRDQIESILNQENVKVILKVRDDGSNDNTVSILNDYQKRGLLQWYTGENKKPAFSFLDLILKAETDYDFYALSDQDDVWLPNKLEKAIEKFKNQDKGNPALYYSVQTYVDENLNIISNQVDFGSKAYSFPQLFVKNMAAGCTMVMNTSLIKLLKKYEPKKISMHDRWIYLVCAGVDGDIYYDTNSYILYRQHSNNVTGTKTKCELFKIRLNRLFGKSQYAFIHATQLKKGYEHDLTQENLKVINNILNYKKSFRKKMEIILDKRFKIKSQQSICYSNISFKLKVIVGKL